MTLRLAAAAFLLVGITACGPGPSSAVSVPPTTPSKPEFALSQAIGITTAGGVFTPLINAGQSLPVVRSETFGNKTNGGSKVGVVLSQKGTAGMETVASLQIDIPSAANDAVTIIVTLSVSEAKQMTVKTTVVETATTQQFGPFPVQ